MCGGGGGGGWGGVQWHPPPENFEISSPQKCILRQGQLVLTSHFLKMVVIWL